MPSTIIFTDQAMAILDLVITKAPVARELTNVLVSEINATLNPADLQVPEPPARPRKRDR